MKYMTMLVKQWFLTFLVAGAGLTLVAEKSMEPSAKPQHSSRVN